MFLLFFCYVVGLCFVFDFFCVRTLLRFKLLLGMQLFGVGELFEVSSKGSQWISGRGLPGHFFLWRESPGGG